MSFPRVPPDMKQTLHDFLVKSQRELDRELARRPKTQDGVLYVGDESPLALTEGLDSTPFFLAIVDGKLVLKDEAGNVVFTGLGGSDLAANGGTIPETDRANNFALMQQVAGSDLIQTGSNSNGTWLIFMGVVQVCFFAEFDSPNRSGAPLKLPMTFPRAFATAPIVVCGRQNDTDTTGYDTATSEPHALNLNATGFDWTIHETGSTFDPSYIAMGVPS